MARRRLRPRSQTAICSFDCSARRCLPTPRCPVFGGRRRASCRALRAPGSLTARVVSGLPATQDPSPPRALCGQARRWGGAATKFPRRAGGRPRPAVRRGQKPVGRGGPGGRACVSVRATITGRAAGKPVEIRHWSAAVGGRTGRSPQVGMPLNYRKWVPTRREMRQGSGWSPVVRRPGLSGSLPGNGVVPVKFHRILTPAALGVCTVLALAASPATADAASSLPQPVSAQSGATWLAGQFTPQGYIPSQSDPGTADLSATANSILALASANVDPGLAATATLLHGGQRGRLRVAGRGGRARTAGASDPRRPRAQASIRRRSAAPISSPASWRPSKRQGTTMDSSARNRN